MFKNCLMSKRLRRVGSVAAFVGITLPVILGVAALGMDGGLIYLQRRQAQTAADSAALAAAYAMKNGATSAAAQSAAATIASQNGIKVTSSEINITTSTSTVVVSVTSTNPRMFSAIWGAGTMSATATATATYSTSSGSSTPYSTSAVVLLNTVNPSMSQSLYLTGSAKLTANAGIQVNSTSSTAVYAANNGQSSSPMNIVGSWGQAYCCLLTGTIKTGAPVVSDPLAPIATPSVPAANTSPTYLGYGSWTMQPGLYTSDPNPRGGSAVTMSPGLYYFQGCGFTVNNGATLTGSGVTIYIDNGGGALSIQGGSPVTLSAPSASTAVNNAIPGLVYFQARASTVAVNFANGTDISMTGTMYAAKAQLVFAGGNTTQIASQIVCDSMNLSNNAQITVPYSSSSVAGSSSYSYPVALTK